MSRVNILRSVGLGLTVVVLIAGALLIGREASNPVANARETLRSYYSNTDAAAVADRIVPGSLGQQVEREQLEAGLGRILQEPFEVEDVSSGVVRGTQVVRVAVARPQGGQPLEWCVLPDGGLLLGCRAATVEMSGEVQGDTPVTVDFAGMDVLVDGAQLAVVLTTSGQDEVPLDGDLRLQGGDFELANTAYLLGGGQQVPADRQDLRIRPGAGLLLLWRSDDVEDLDATTADAAPYTLTWGSGSVQLNVEDITWFVGRNGAQADTATTDGAPTPAPTSS